MDKYLNFNVGILGHVDSGKTSLARSLSTVASTAAFDKNPQSQERGITIDLGFSSFCVDAPNHIAQHGFEKLQFTLVDCPGHASLIRTVIGGAKIIDAMLLVIDIMKGVQTQTAECLIIGEILCKNMIVVLNKIDLVVIDKRQATIDKMSRKLLNTLKNTNFSAVNIVSVAANAVNEENSKFLGMDKLIDSMKSFSYLPHRYLDKPFVFSVDHCFGIKGQGSIVTGTILQGTVHVNDSIEIPTLKVDKKVKSLQMFHHPVDQASQGDRVGMCITQFDPKLVERGLITKCGYINLAYGFIARVTRISYYKHPIHSKAKFHISLGHDTLMANVRFFGTEDLSVPSFNIENEYISLSELTELDKVTNNFTAQFGLIEFEKLVPVLPDSIFIASKLDMDIHTSMCRLAFWGTISDLLPENYKVDVLPKVKVFKNKSREGIVERMNSESELIVKNLIKKGTDISLFSGLKLELSTGENAVIDSYFGQSGKIKVRVTSDLKPDTKLCLKSLTTTRKRGKKDPEAPPPATALEPVRVVLKYKKFIFSQSKKIVQ